ncbi:cation-translocating P-type ATPase [Oscillospiraceae bacterium OttesenSCG-928-G22]|nr:cation-translocating P-type ATPase [Oscillospiraceae bacterium OttesenSCG-928-G22]
MRHYAESAETVLSSEQTTSEGLSPSEAASRLETHGKNQLLEAGKKSLLSRFIDQLKDPMILILIAAAVISGAFGEIADMIVILIVVLLNAVLGVIQENKAEDAIAALKKMSAPHSRVRRGGAVLVVDSADIVPGDIVLLEAGDSIPADMRLLTCASLKIEEAALTGESVAAEKAADAIEAGDKDVSLGDRLNMAYMGTNVVYGRGEGVVTATGMKTEMGKIAGILSSTELEKTPLQKTLSFLSKVLSIGVLFICAFIFVFSVLQNGGFQGGHVFEMFLTAVSLAVAAIPEGLVVVVTVVLSIGVTKMSKRNAIIRRLTTVETLGCTEIICSDKTGTLTQNKMTVVDHTGDELPLARAMALCTDVQVDPSGALVGEPTETALVAYLRTLGLEKQDLERETPRIGEAPFDSVRKMMSTVHQTETGVIQYTKGAPDEVLRHCNSIFIDGAAVPLTDELREKVLNDNRGMAERALRVLAGASREHVSPPAEYSPEALETGLTFIGLTGIIDPVRPEVKDAILECRRAGIRPIMITGDHKTTATAIALELGIIKSEDEAITGAELSELSDEAFEKAVTHYTVYARVQPEHKVRIVNMWKKKGKITAMTGDGVNDAPALKSADIGVGMGITGTDVTKNVADMVLADDNFATIVYAVEEGRRIYDNIRKAIQFLLASNLSEVISIFIATLQNIRLFAPIHILWINLVTDSLPAIALGMEEAEADVMENPPRSSKDSIFSGGLGVNVVYQGVIISVLTLVSFFIGNAQNHITGMTMAFLTLSMCEIFHSINMRSRSKSIFRMTTANKYLIGAMILSFVLTIAVIYIPGVNDVFELSPLSLSNFVISFGLSLAIIPVVEIVKLIARAFSRRK